MNYKRIFVAVLIAVSVLLSGCGPTPAPANTPTLAPAGIPTPALAGTPTPGTAGQNIVDLVAQGSVTFKIISGGINELGLKIQNTTGQSLQIDVPAGTYFVNKDPKSQNMVVLRQASVSVKPNGQAELHLEAACANLHLTEPTQDNAFTIQRTPKPPELARIIEVLNSAGVDYPVEQAAVWIVTDNATYDELGLLVQGSRFGSSIISENDTLRAMMLVDQAGLSIRNYAIWGDRNQLMLKATEPDLSAWLSSQMATQAVLIVTEMAQQGTRTAEAYLTGTPTPAASATSTTPSPGASMESPVDGMMLVYVPAGSFFMGADPATDPGAGKDEKPLHTVSLDAFWIDQTEVTNGMYKKCVAAGVCALPKSETLPTDRDYYNKPDFDAFPVVYVSRVDAKTYCAWAGRQLPTEAQWEKAARGTDRRPYPWGNSPDFKDRITSGMETQSGSPSAVGSYPQGASPYGALDMSGNVFEWVNDIYGAQYYAQGSMQNPTGPTAGTYGVVRGGSWVVKDPVKLTVSYRLANAPLNRDADDGFRCAQKVAP